MMIRSLDLWGQGSMVQGLTYKQFGFDTKHYPRGPCGALRVYTLALK